MPRSRSVESLEQLCVQSIVDNLGKFNSSSAGRRISSAASAISENVELINRFDCLPSRFVVSILGVAISTRGLNVENLLDLLITTRLERLDLSQWIAQPSLHGSCGTKLNDQTVLRLLRRAALKHSPLKTLRMPSGAAIPCRYFKDLLPAFPNLTQLDVSDSSGESVNNEFLALLATHCLKLEELCLIDCQGVTDVGIQHLCGSQEGCKFLLRLNVEGTRVTRRGARLAMEHLPRLQFFHHPATLQIAAEMYRTNSTGQLSLKNLAASLTWSDYNLVPYVRGSWVHALRLCPLVVHVRMSRIHNLADEDLTSLLHLKWLKNLTIDNCHGISFNDGVLPILEKFGPSSLTSLNLRDVPEVNIGSIVEFCSNLREIRLDRIRRYSPARPGLRPSPPHHHLPHLRLLTMKGYDPELPAYQPSNADLSLLLSSAPALEGIEFDCLLKFNEGILEEAIAHHGFPDLKSFQVELCPGITKGVVDLLLELDNPLSLISIEKNQRDGSCRATNPHVCDDPAWKETILKQNLDVAIRYCECREWILDLDLLLWPS